MSEKKKHFDFRKKRDYCNQRKAYPDAEHLLTRNRDEVECKDCLNRMEGNHLKKVPKKVGVFNI